MYEHIGCAEKTYKRRFHQAKVGDNCESAMGKGQLFEG